MKQTCSKFGELIIWAFLGSLLLIGTHTAMAEVADYDLMQLQYNHQDANQVQIPLRQPANYIPNDEVEPVPPRHQIFLEKVFVRDSAGILEGTREEVDQWQKTEDFNRNWNLKSTGMYKSPSDKEKRSFMSKRILKYFDKRIAGEAKHAEKGSTLHKVSQVQKAQIINSPNFEQVCFISWLVFLHFFHVAFINNTLKLQLFSPLGLSNCNRHTNYSMQN